ncbi:hypothetical protein GNF98_21915, partial [Clostridium perfringens]
GIVNLNRNDIIFLESRKPIQRVAVHTVSEEFYLPGTLKFWASALNNSGQSYRIVDRNIAVNIDKIVMMDSYRKRAYFSNEVNQTSKFCTLAFWRYSELEKEFMMLNPHLIISGIEKRPTHKAGPLFFCPFIY